MQQPTAIIPMMSFDQPEYYPVARILKSHGVKGEMKVEPLTPYFSLCDWETGCRIVDRFARTREGHLTGMVERGQVFYIRLKGVDDKTAADALAGAMICLRREQLPVLPEGEYYVFELKGLRVFNTEGRFLGVLSDIRQGLEYDWYEVRLEASGKRYLVPAVNEFISQLDVPAGRMTIRDIPGLFDTNGAGVEVSALSADDAEN